MATPNNSVLPPPTPDHRRAAAGQFERANQVVATGNYDYGIRLLLSCCKLDPANLIYRQRLRLTEKAKYRNNLRGSWLAWLTTWSSGLKLKAAKRGRDWLKVLEHGEQVLMRNPWHIGAQMDMAEAADVLGLLDLAIWNLEQARQAKPLHVPLNRSLAKLYEKRGNFTQAGALWGLVRKVRPEDVEAQHKIKDLAVHETIAKGNYEEALGGSALSHPGVHPPGAEAASAGPPSGKNSAGKPPSGKSVAGPASGKNLAGPPSGKKVAGPTSDKNLSGPGSSKVLRPPATPVVGSSGEIPLLAERVAREAAPLRARLEADPTVPNLYLQLAGLYRRADQFEQALEVLKQGLGPTGNSFELMLELADLEIEPFRRNLALTEQKLKDQPDDPDLRKIRIRLRKEVNTRELDLYRQKADRFPTEMAHRYEMGVRLLRGGQLDEAIRELQAARADPRYRCQALQYLGHCFKARNNWRLAQRNFEEALQALPPAEAARRKELLYELAQGCAEAGDLAHAVDLAHELANLDFAYRDIGRLLDDWQTRLKQTRVSP